MKKPVHVLAILVGILMTGSSTAQTPAWERLNPFPQSQEMIDIVKIPGTNRLIAAGMGSTIMLSDDIGVTWQYFLYPAGLGSDFIAHKFTFINETTGFLTGKQHTILKTTDAGITWKVVYTDSLYSFMDEVEFIGDSIGYAIGDERLYLKTEDQGETWNRSDPGYQVGLEEMEFFNQSIGFIDTGSNSQILKTTDGGITWVLIPFPEGIPQNTYIWGMQFIDASIGFLSTCSYRGNTVIYKTTDSGLSWYSVSDTLIGWIGRQFSFIDQSNGIFVGSDQLGQSRIFITADGGETWELSEQAIDAGVLAIGLCYNDQNNVFSTGFNGSMYKSSDGGHNWEKISQNNLDGYIEDAVVFGQNNGILLTNTFNGHFNVLKTSNGFESFENLLTIPGSSKSINFPDPMHGFCFYEDYPYNICYRTGDGGYSWTSDTISDYFLLSVSNTDFLDSQKGIVLCRDRFFITLNGGEFWEESSIAEENEYNSVDWISENDLVISGMNQDTSALFISHDTGISWETVEIPMNEKVTFINENIAFLFYYNHILKTTNGGYTWNECVVNTDHPFNSFRDISFPTPDTGYLAGWAYYNNMLKTVDAGETWNPINAPVTSAFNLVKFIDAQNGYIFNLNDIFRTTTGGIVDIANPDLESTSEQFQLYPNPFKDEVKIELESLTANDRVEMRIINAEGKQVYSTTITGNPDLVVFNGYSLKPGVYFFGFIKNGSVIETKKMIRK